MVNRGASGACTTCKERRVKCDEARPVCKECARVGRKCAGYGRQTIQVRFKDESARYLNRPPNHTTTVTTAKYEEPKETTTNTCVHRPPSVSRSHVAIPRNPQSKQQDIAVAFFLTYVTHVGRNLESTRAFLEFVRPVPTAESHKSALFAAVNATALKLWALLRPCNLAPSLPIHLHSHALMRLQQAIHSPMEQGKDATVLAALMLQYHDTLAAISDHHEAHSTHREGALALLAHKSRNMRNFKYHGHLLGNLFHSKISFCVRHKVSLTRRELDWLQTEVIPTLPSNPSSLLDVIGISISKLQGALTQSLSPQRDVASGALQELPAIVCNVDAQLRTWLDAVPQFWHPRRMQSENSTPSSVATYQGSFEIYPSVQIANIWNTWRAYGFIVEHVKMEFTNGSLIISDGGNFLVDIDRMFESTGTQHVREIQDLIDSICRSIPLYLGNCSQPVSFSNIDNPHLVFPSYHDLPPADEAFISYKNSDHYVSKVDHYRHVLLHGPLHALSVLSSVIGLFSEERCSALARGLLYRQKQWIDEQFHRCLYLMRFVPRIFECTGEPHRLGSPDSRPCSSRSSSAALAQATRRVLSTVTIL